MTRQRRRQSTRLNGPGIPLRRVCTSYLVYLFLVFPSLNFIPAPDLRYAGIHLLSALLKVSFFSQIF